MSLIATLKEIQTSNQPGFLTDNRPAVIDGSLSEAITRALYVSHSRKDFYTGMPFAGQENPDVDVPDGGGTLSNPLKPDEPNKAPRVAMPSLETQAMDEQEIVSIVGALGGDIVDAKNSNEVEDLQEAPIMVYALPEDGKVPTEMGEKIESYIDSGAVDVNDFVFVFSDTAKTAGGYKVMDVNQKVKDYEAKGAKVFADLQSFLHAWPDLRKRR
jgi:hypothetical protein